ncbi:hypothetical protein CEXT_678511 [Caerostris extrusa]|uniref:Uncharacterized protein n=1 Tax=Caerostris extrusa TaxID=172846 RepID=A0AAV4UMG5_CAEEX|nr:hypothetical protein CEXT_678511 [Caerostris extrusa]
MEIFSEKVLNDTAYPFKLNGYNYKVAEDLKKVEDHFEKKNSPSLIQQSIRICYGDPMRYEGLADELHPPCCLETPPTYQGYLTLLCNSSSVNYPIRRGTRSDSPRHLSSRATGDGQPAIIRLTNSCETNAFKHFLHVH